MGTRYKDATLWARLSLEGRFDVIDKLRHVKSGEGGFGSIVVPEGGFSEDDVTHNMVLDYLREHDVNIVNTRLITENLRRSLCMRRRF